MLLCEVIKFFFATLQGASNYNEDRWQVYACIYSGREIICLKNVDTKN